MPSHAQRHMPVIHVCLLSSTGLNAARKLYMVSALLDKAQNYWWYWLCLNLRIMGNGYGKLPHK